MARADVFNLATEVALLSRAALDGPRSPDGRKLAELVAARIESEVVARRWPVGTLIGSEASLIARFGVSRATLREAVRIVESHQVARMRRGPKGGLIVSSPRISTVRASAALFLDWADVETAELFEVRSALELACVEQLVAALDDRLVTSLRAALHGEERFFARHGIRSELPDLHSQLAYLTGNPVQWLFVDVLTRLTQQRANQHVPNDRMTAEELHRTHSRIVEAIIDGDVLLAQRRMRRHLHAVSTFDR